MSKYQINRESVR